MMMMVEDEGIFRWLDYERRKGFIGRLESCHKGFAL